MTVELVVELPEKWLGWSLSAWYQESDETSQQL